MRKKESKLLESYKKKKKKEEENLFINHKIHTHVCTLYTTHIDSNKKFNENYTFRLYDEFQVISLLIKSNNFD